MDKEKCIARARTLGAEYETMYNNDAQATFQAIVDALKEIDVVLTDPTSEEIVFKSLAGLAGGHALTGNGNAGSLSGATAAISLLSNVGRAELLVDKNQRWIAYDNAMQSVFQDFVREYRGLTDKHVMWARYGKWWNYWDVEAWQDYLVEREERGYLGAGVSTVSIAAGWGAGYALDILAHPRTFEQVKVDHNL